MFMKQVQKVWILIRMLVIQNLQTEQKAKDRISVIGYPKGAQTKYKMFESTGTINHINGTFMEFDAYAQPGNSGSPVLNSKNELIGILYAGSGKDESEKNYGVYFTPQLKEFIQNNIEK